MLQKRNLMGIRNEIAWVQHLVVVPNIRKQVMCNVPVMDGS